MLKRMIKTSIICIYEHAFAKHTKNMSIGADELVYYEETFSDLKADSGPIVLITHAQPHAVL